MKWYVFIAFFILPAATTSNAQSCITPQLSHYQFIDIKNILEKNNCQNCHFKDNTQSIPWHFTTYKDLIARGKCGPIVDHGNPQTSLLVDKLNQGSITCGSNMPLGSDPISSRDLLAIENWILVGAPEFCIPTFPEIKEIFEKNDCKQCHQQTGEWRFDSHEKIFQKSAQAVCTEALIVPFHHRQSVLYRKISGESVTCGQKMPTTGTPMSQEDVSRIRDWINSGAFSSSPSLPVVLTDFSAENLDDTSVLLYWQSSSEYNTAFYYIEHSLDGVHFEEIGVRDARSQSNELVNYEFYDLSPGYGNQYYRLKIVDNDGLYTLSPARAVRIKNTVETLRIYPTSLPPSHTLTIEWLPSLEEERTKIHFMDILGREVYSLVIYPGVNAATMPNLNPGLYYAVIQHDVENYFIKKMILVH